MSIQMNCPKCRSPYTLKDDSLGKTVRCKKCQNLFTVEPPEVEEEVVAAVVEPGPGPEPVAKVKRKEKPARSLPNMSPGLMILAGVAGVLLLISCCGGVSLTGYYIFAGGKHGGGNGLDGKYVVESACIAGQELPKDKVASMFSEYVISGEKISYKMSGNAVSGSFSLNPKTNPPSMDFLSEGKTTPCIYKLEGDRLTIAMGMPAVSDSRPKDFNPTSALAIMVMKRQ